MPEYICLVKKEKAAQAEDVLRKDFDIAAKQSITVREASGLSANLEGFIFYIRGSEEGINRCKELIKEFIKEADKSELEKARKKIEEDEGAAAVGFGNIFG